VKSKLQQDCKKLLPFVEALAQGKELKCLDFDDDNLTRSKRWWEYDKKTYYNCSNWIAMFNDILTKKVRVKGELIKRNPNNFSVDTDGILYDDTITTMIKKGRKR